MLRRPTEILRVTVDQDGNSSIDTDRSPNGGPVVAAEGAHQGELPGTYRCVQILTPEMPGILASLTQAPREAGPSRTGYKYAPLPPASLVKFRLQPEQELFLASTQGDGAATCTVIIEYCEGEP